MNYKSRVINVGGLLLGGDNPIRIQSMTNTQTLDTDSTIRQSIKLIEAGSELVRITASGIKEAENLINVKREIRNAGFSIPLVADIHFNHRSAEIAAAIVEKVRINPGNYVSKSHASTTKMSGVDFRNPVLWNPPSLYDQELELIEQNLKPLVEICMDHGTAIRIGVNHGSLGNRIINRFGDTVEGMVESALEYARIFDRLSFGNLVISVKSSNTRIMADAYVLLADKLMEEGLNFPLHIGVTEAGNGIEGRMKSIVGIGAVLNHGIGDTIRVSLTEDPVNEISVAKAIVKRIGRGGQVQSTNLAACRKEPTMSNEPIIRDDLLLDSKSSETKDDRQQYGGFPKREDPAGLFLKHREQVFQASPDGEIKRITPEPFILMAPANEVDSSVRLMRASGNLSPVILQSCVKARNLEELMIENCLHPGTLLLNGIGQGLCIDVSDLQNSFPDTHSQLDFSFIKEIIDYGFQILQATRARFTTNEYIACPSCGRTHFDIEKRLEEVKLATAHLKGLKIAVMGCIVNGPGEMADADYGYVGAGKGKITLYRGEQAVIKNIPEAEAVQQLLLLIQEDKRGSI